MPDVTAIEERDASAPRTLHAGIPCGRHADVARHRLPDDACILAVWRHGLEAGIGMLRAIVDDDQLPARHRLRERAVDARSEARNARAIRRQDDADAGRAGLWDRIHQRSRLCIASIQALR